MIGVFCVHAVCYYCFGFGSITHFLRTGNMYLGPHLKVFQITEGRRAGHIYEDSPELEPDINEVLLWECRP